MEIKSRNVIASLPSLLALVIGLFWTVVPAEAHHVLGRPSYALNEDSNTPPALQVESKIGEFFVNYMIYPAFPRPGDAGRINLYITNRFTGNPFVGKVAFTVRDNSWKAWAGLGANEEKLGAQILDDNVYRQGFVFRKPGAYIITAEFHQGKEPYRIDFPLQVGQGAGYSRIVKITALVIFAMIGLTLFQSRRIMTGRIRRKQDGKAKL